MKFAEPSKHHTIFSPVVLYLICSKAVFNPSVENLLVEQDALLTAKKLSLS
jgi:hypothetical protein